MFSGFEPYSRWLPLFNALWCACVVDEIEDYRDYFSRGVDSQVTVNLFYLVVQTMAFAFHFIF